MNKHIYCEGGLRGVIDPLSEDGARYIRTQEAIGYFIHSETPDTITMLVKPGISIRPMAEMTQSPKPAQPTRNTSADNLASLKRRADALERSLADMSSRTSALSVTPQAEITALDPRSSSQDSDLVRRLKAGEQVKSPSLATRHWWLTPSLFPADEQEVKSLIDSGNLVQCAPGSYGGGELYRWSYKETAVQPNTALVLSEMVQQQSLSYWQQVAEAQAAETAAREAMQRRNEMGAGIYNPTTGRYER